MNRLRRALAALLLPLSIVPFVAVAPSVLGAYKNFDRRHKSEPLPVPNVRLSPGELNLYQPLPPNPGAVPVLTYHGISDRSDGYSVRQAEFARQLEMLRHMGFRSLSIAQYVRFLRGDTRGLPERPLLITFDDGRLDSYRGADRVLQRYGFRATMFVIPGQMKQDNPFYLTWKELGTMARGRWDIQEHAGAGHYLIAYDAGGNTGPFYAYRQFTRSGGLESLADWEQRVTTDIYAGRNALVDHVPGFRALTFAVPYGNYGQRGTNDARIPGLMRSFLARQFRTTFVQRTGNEPDYTTPAALHGEAERYEVHTTTSPYALYRWLHDHAPGAQQPRRPASPLAHGHATKPITSLMRRFLKHEFASTGARGGSTIE